MRLSIRSRFILVAILAAAVIGGLVVLERSTRPDAASAIRERLLGESPRAVEAVLGQPSFRENNDKTWHYMDPIVVTRVAERAVSDQTLVVEFDAEGQVSSVYLAE